jgi:hypothetical protein
MDAPRLRSAGLAYLVAPRAWWYSKDAAAATAA